MRTLAFLGLIGLLPVVQAQGAVLSPEAIVVNPVPAYEVRVSTQDLDGNTKTNFAVGEAIRVSVRVTEDAYVYLFDVRSDGSINQILPNRYDANGQNNFVRADETKYFPPEGAQYNFTAAAPAGVDKVIAVASQTPLDTSTLATFQQDPELCLEQSERTRLCRRALGDRSALAAKRLGYRHRARLRRRGRGSGPDAAGRHRHRNVRSGWARVLIDDLAVGTTPLRYSVLSGTHRIRVEAEGYSTF